MNINKMNVNKIANRTEKFICLLIILTCVKPEGISEISPKLYSVLYIYGFYISFLIAISLFLIAAIKRRTVSNFMILFLLFIGYMIFVTVLNDGPIYTCVNMWIRSITILFLFEAYRDKMIDILYVFTWVLLILVGMNLWCMLRYPQGMYVMEGTNYTNCWLLGYKSSFQYYFLPLIVVALLFKHYCNKNIIFVVALVLVHIESILALNIMFVVELVVLDFFVYFKLINKVSVFNAKMYSAIIVAANFVFIFGLTKLIHWKPVYYLFNNILGKNTTLFTRMNAWFRGIQFIQEKFILGWGYTTSIEMRRLFGISVVHLHNQFLMLLLQVGLLGTIIFCLLMGKIIKSLYINKESYAAKIISLAIFCLFIGVLVEIFLTGTAACVWPIIYIGQYSEEFDLLNCKKRNVLKMGV